MSQSAGLLEIHGAEAVSDKEWQRYTRVHPKAVLLRAWGGEQPPMGVLNDALAQVQQHMDGWARVDHRAGRPNGGGGWPFFPLSQFEVGGGMRGFNVN